MDRDRACLADILVACRDITAFIGEESKDEFLSSTLVISAVVRQLEIIGEATKRLSAAFREVHPEIPWKDMAGLRDRLIHAYDEVDLDLVWQIATRRVPDVRPQLEALLSDPK
jgi:uncharacterized protein with HEPN domain